MPPPDHYVRLRDGDTEIEVSGNPAFVRQVLDDLPSLMARLRGEAPGRTTISMPAPPSTASTGAMRGAALTAEVVKHEAPPGNGSAAHAEVGAGSLEERVLEVLRVSTKPLPIAAIRQRLDDEVTGQQVRRLLEKAGTRVTVSDDRPAAYSLR